MPINERGMNDDIVEYFPLQQYISNIILEPYVLNKVYETNENFNQYMQKLFTLDEELIIDYWIYQSYNELKWTKKIENIDFTRVNLLDDNIFFNSLNISHKRIHELHNFITNYDCEPSFEYRNHEVRVSRYLQNGDEEIFYRGAQSKDVKKFMNDFIDIYKRNDISFLMSNPFLKSALVHLLFVRIHPYGDGNGRTARLLHNSKFTELLNRTYKTKLKISPLPISESISRNVYTYVNSINNIYFDLEHDSNEAINKWFYYNLIFADEQMRASSTELDLIDLDQVRTYAISNNEKYNKKMKIKSLK